MDAGRGLEANCGLRQQGGDVLFQDGVQRLWRDAEFGGKRRCGVRGPGAEGVTQDGGDLADAGVSCCHIQQLPLGLVESQALRLDLQSKLGEQARSSSALGYLRSPRNY